MIKYNPISKKTTGEKVIYENQPNQNFLRVRTANQCLEDAKNMPIQNLLISELWCEGELGILFSDTNVGKSIFAVKVPKALVVENQIMVLI